MKYLLITLLSLSVTTLSAQVGINNENPSQALDVGGKIKVGDDETTPVAGTIRYNRVAKTFEGFDGTEWSVFNPEADGSGGNVPASGTVVSGHIDTESNFINQVFLANLYYNPSGDPFYGVPAGRTLFITHINIFPEGGAYSYVLYTQDQYGGSLNHAELKIMDTNPTKNQQFTDPGGHLLIIPSQASLAVRKNVGGSASRIYFRGFLQ